MDRLHPLQGWIRIYQDQFSLFSEKQKIVHVLGNLDDEKKHSSTANLQTMLELWPAQILLALFVRYLQQKEKRRR